MRVIYLLPLLAVSSDGGGWQGPMLAVGKALVFVLLMLTLGPRVFGECSPWRLDTTATRPSP